VLEMRQACFPAGCGDRWVRCAGPRWMPASPDWHQEASAGHA